MTPAHPEDTLLVSGVPVLIPDTCALLDLVRVPVRESFTTHDGAAALALLALVESGRIAVVVPEKVQSEYADNVAKVHGETANTLERMVDAIEKMLIRLKSIGAAALPEPPAVKAFANTGRTLADRFLAHAVSIEAGAEEQLKAFNRQVTATRPAQKGKESHGDYLITETNLALARRLKEAGHPGPFLFVSSNVDDYCIPGSRLAPPLDEEFQTVGLAFACRWAAAGWLAR